MFPVDPKAPSKKQKRYPLLPWQCQVGCHGECTSGDGSRPPERITPPPTVWPDRQQLYYQEQEYSY